MSLHKSVITYESEVFKHYYLCRYLPFSFGKDDLSKSIIQFKNGNSLDLQAWTECAASELGHVGIAKDSLIVRVLNSREVSVSPPGNTSLDYLGRILARVLSCDYRPMLLKKNRTTQAAKQLKRDEREQEYSNVYFMDKNFPISNDPTFLILDDIVTTGTTVKAVIKAIRKVFAKARIYIFTLASTQYNIDLQAVRLSGYTYEWKNESGWVVMEENEEYGTELSILKDKIIRDSF